MYTLDLKEVLFADLHIHSRYSRACSKSINFENLVKWAKIKGLNLLGTGDFTHPIWFNEIKRDLIEKDGIYYHNDFPFIITGEVSLIYTQGGKGRKVHLVLLVPSIKIAEKIHDYLDGKGLRRDYDGRPIFGISCESFTRDMKNISDDIEIIPAHIWTPYFGVFGSLSGFDSLTEAFGDQAGKIYAIETGISSDPEMNWRIKEFENISVLSFSDSHSFWPFRLGREATIFKKVSSYSDLIKQIRENDFIGTIETDPAYGKYHWDGHASCNFSCSPSKCEELNNICPVCHKQLTPGVDHRVESLASFPTGHSISNSKIFYKILPLQEILSLGLNSGIESKKVWGIYNSFIDYFGNEFNVLLKTSREEFISKDIDEKLINLILKNREGKIKVIPGFDGEYGKAVFDVETQNKLF